MDLTEFIELTPTRVDAVSSPANGISFLLLKSLSQTEAEEEQEDEEAASTAAKFLAGYCTDSECDVCKARFDVLSDEDIVKAKLTSKKRKALPNSAFVFPKERKYPIQDKSHARNALARVSQFGTPQEKAKVRAAVRRKYPTIKVDKEVTPNTTKDSEVWAHLQDAEDAVREAQMDQKADDAAKNTAPNKSVPKGEALSQTEEVDDDCSPGPGGAQDGGTPARPAATSSSQSRTTGEGDTAPNKTVPRGEAESQTRIESRKAAAEAARKLISTASAVFGLSHDEKRAARAVDDLTRSLTKSGLLPTPDKEITTMTKDELFNLLDERDKARRKAVAKKAKKARAEKRAKRARAAKRAAKAAAKAGEQTPQIDPVVKNALDDVRAQLLRIEGSVAGQSTPLPYLNGATVATQRGQGNPVGDGDAFKGLRDRIAATQTDRERHRLEGELLRAIAIASERNRQGTAPGPQPGGTPVVLPG